MGVWVHKTIIKGEITMNTEMFYNENRMIKIGGYEIP
jgi:hypothetical protein